jgi:transcription-repair coupling factor (superfamily II helicase)
MNSLSFTQLLQTIRPSQGVNNAVNSFLQNKLPLEITGFEGSFPALFLAQLYSGSEGLYVVVVPHESDAADIASDLRASEIPCSIFPWWGAASYRELSAASAVFGERVKVLGDLALEKNGIVIIPQRALLTPVSPPGYLKKLLIKIRSGGKIDTPSLANTLVSWGYTRVPQVQVCGEFALRGEVLDIFMGGETVAYRILFNFDTVESVKQFDPFIQSTSKAKNIDLWIRPLKEVIWTDDRIDALQIKLASCQEFTDKGNSIIEELITHRRISGEEMFFPLAFEKSANLLDYLKGSGTVVLFERERLENMQEILEREYKGLYKQSKRENYEYPLPERLLLDFNGIIKHCKRTVSFKAIKGGNLLDVNCASARSFFGNIEYLKEEFAALLGSGWKIVITTESEVQANRIQMMFEPHNSLFILPFPLMSGFQLTDIKLLLIQETEIFGRRRRPPRSLRTVRSSPIDTFVELNPGDYVVHINYGIGLFKGIERIKALGHERDYIQLEYAKEEIVFVPVEQVNLVQRYIGNQGLPARLDTLGSKSWENRKGRVKKSVEDIAEKLIDIYSKRKQAQGFAFPKDSEWQIMFEAAFPYEETEDQLKCVEEIKADMESRRPMDRLICGDVGYGKTEVALRACFKAIMGGKQAAFLAPTTILAEQHFENFKERFVNFPVKTAMLSRFIDRKNATIILDNLKKGEIDILVGTHRIIQRDVLFKNLGLIVIDEEQRFGVKDKERLKEIKTNVDCLTLSATPIPRTLHMSLVKIRDISLLTTPPDNRHPIETFVEEYNNDRIVKAVRKEVKRGGQVFFLHNRIETLKDIRVKLEKLMPEIMVETAHGQMESRELEDIMRRFIHGGFHVLVSTTIIENGIDIPNVNTIIIDRADMYGVSQLYQLRGRVGRSDRVAYAYLFYPKGQSLSEIAMKRLQVISDFTELGSGFKIAMKDMEIRGAGNLLGREQSGDIYSVGFDMYVKLLEDAVMRLENSNYESETETLLELEYSGFIPDTYIDSPQEKMEVYKMIAAIRDGNEFDKVYAELLDRFGPLPDEAASLLSLAEIRIICRKLAVSVLRERNGLALIEFSRVSRVNVERLLQLIRDSAGKVKLDPKRPNVLTLATGNIGLHEKSEFICEKLSALV